MNELINIANRTIPAPLNKEKIFKGEYNYDTDEIINVISWSHDKALRDTKKLALAIPGRTVEEYLQNLYNLLKQNVRYQIDPPGTQWVKFPAQVWAEKYADCKSYSLFIATVLHNKGIPFKYRFVSYSKTNPTPTHVYVVVPKKNGTYITMDVVWRGYNQEKPFNHKKDMQKTRGLSAVMGIGADPDKAIDLGGRDLATLSEGQLDAIIARDRLKIQQEITANIRGINSTSVKRYQASINVLDDALEAMDMYNDNEFDESDLNTAMQAIAVDAISGVYTRASLNGTEVNGLFSKIKSKVKKAAKKVGGAIKKVAKKVGNSKTGKFLKKVGKAVAKPAMKIAKVLSWPQRRLMEEIIEKRLPKSAPHFLYLFIPEKEVSKFPVKVQNKRKRQVRLRKFITDISTIKQSQFMGIIRNGILKKFKKEPERLIQDMANGKKISGIGAMPRDAYTSAKGLLSSLESTFKRKSGIIIATDDSPNPNDFRKPMNLKVNRSVPSKPTARPTARRTTPSRSVPARSTQRPASKFTAKPTSSRSVRPVQPVKPVRTAPEQTIVQKLRPELEKAAPFFLYLFINDTKIFPKLPAAIRDKRKTQERVADFIVSTTKIGRSELMAIWRAGIKKQTGKDPETILSASLKSAGIQGIGEIGEIGWVASAISAVLAIINKLVGLFKKKSKDAPKVTKDDSPDESDFSNVTLQKGLELANDIEQTAAVIKKETGRSSKSSKKSSAPSSQAMQAERTTMDVPDDYDDNFSSGGTSIWNSLK